MKIKDLSKNPENPRTITEAKQRMLLKSYRRFGDLSGIVFNRKTKQLVGGHQRQDIFDPETPIVISQKYSKPTKTGTVAQGYVEIKGERISYREVYWDDHTEKAAAIAANKGAGEWDPAKLETWIKDLSGFDVDFDMELTMFDPQEIKDIVGIEVEGYTRSSTHATTGVEEDSVPEKPRARSKTGDLYVLGSHRLICGDGLDDKLLERLLEGQQSDMVFTDPPYNIGFGGSMSNTSVNGVLVKHKGANQKHGEIENDKMTREQFFEFIHAALENIKKFTAGAWYITFGSQTLDQLLGPLRNCGMDWKSIIIWKKNQATLSGKDYKSRYEPIVYGRFNEAFFAERYVQEDIWEFQRTLKNDLHPTMKPVPLIEQAIVNSSEAGMTILDIFGGSGSTMIACEKTQRRCCMVEIDPHYCDVIVARWEKYTGLKAQLVRAETKRRPAMQGRSRPHAAQAAAKA